MQSVAAESISISIFVVSLDPSSEGEGEEEPLTLKVVLDSLRDTGAEGVDKTDTVRARGMLCIGFTFEW